MIDWFEKHKNISWLVTFLIAVIIFYISTLDFGGAVPTKGFGWQATAYHFFAFFFFAAFLLISLIQGKKTNLILSALIIAILYGISDEIHQIFVPNRYFDFEDVLINSAGVLFAGILYSLRMRFWRNKKIN